MVFRSCLEPSETIASAFAIFISPIDGAICRLFAMVHHRAFGFKARKNRKRDPRRDNVARAPSENAVFLIISFIFLRRIIRRALA
jgi:hypothetical protein